MKHLFLLLAIALSANAQSVWRNARLANVTVVQPAASPLLTDLVAYWDMDETSGSRADSVGSSTLADTGSVGYATGRVGNGASFTNGVGQYLSCADNPAISLGADTDFTVAIWVKQTSVDAVGRCIFQKNEQWYGQTTCEYQLLNYWAQRLYFHVGNGSANAEIDWQTAIPNADTWYFLVAWHDKAEDKVYLQVNNGTPQESAWSGGTQDTTAALYVGARFDGDKPFNGVLDEFGIWKRVLTADERTELYNSGNGKTYPF